MSSLKKLIPHNAGDNWAFVSMLRFSDHVPSKRYCALWPFPPSRRSHALLPQPLFAHLVFMLYPEGKDSYVSELNTTHRRVLFIG